MPQPDTLDIRRENIPIDLVRCDQWVRWEWKLLGDHWTKVPYQLTNKGLASSDDPDTWDSFIAAEEGTHAQIGFMFSVEDEFCGVDLDDCVDPKTGEISPEARRIVEMLGSYSEISPTGTGVKIFVRGRVPGKRRREAKKGVEMYDSLRFFTVTGHHLAGTPTTIEDRQEELEVVYKWTFGKSADEEHQEASSSTGMANHDLSDEDILSKAFRARNGEKFFRLWNGDASDYGSSSEADLAMCAMISFWTGPDPARIEDLFGKSHLAREKWHTRADYRKKTVQAVLEGAREFYTPPRTELGTAEPSTNGKGSGLATFSMTDLMAEEIPPPRWVVPDLIPEGSMIFAGKPKMGKSWLVYDLCYDVATGGAAFGSFPVEQGEVLYLALEDNKRRLKDRGESIMQERAPTPHLHFSMQARTLDSGLIADLHDWLDKHPDCRLVVIDTLKRIRPKGADARSLYDQDYEVGEPLTDLAQEHHLAAFAVHHLNKLRSDDPLELISGSTGLTGGVDGATVLNYTRGESDAQITVVHRDLKANREIALSYDHERGGGWKYVGEAEEFFLSKDRRDIVEVISNAQGTMRPKEVAEILDKPVQNVAKLMQKMRNEGQLHSPDYGLYELGPAAVIPPTLHTPVQVIQPVQVNRESKSEVGSLGSLGPPPEGQVEMEWE